MPLYFSKTSSKKIYIQFHKYLFCINSFFLSNMHKGLFFTISVANKIFKTFFTKRDLIRYYYLINIYIAYWNRAFMFGKFLFFYFSITEIYNFLSIFIHTFTIFYIFTIYLPFFLLNQHFPVNLQLKNFSIKKYNFKIPLWKNTKLPSQEHPDVLALIYFSSKSWEEFLRSPAIYLITFFFQCTCIL